MVYSYPFVDGAGLDGLTKEDVHAFLKSPSLVARRVAELARDRFIADFLLKGRYSADGGGVTFEVDGAIMSEEDPETIQAGAEYPLTTVKGGKPQTVPSEKEGQDNEVYDETIARMLLDPVERALRGMVNRMIKRTDAKALATLASEVTATEAAAATWTTPEAVIESVLLADAKLGDHDIGLTGDVVVLPPKLFAKVSALFLKADLLANGADGAMASGMIGNVLGKAWVTSNEATFTDPMLVDSNAIGGIGIEDIGSPGYVTADGTLGIQTKVQRLAGADDRDGYRLRVRRVGVAAIVEPRAGVRITGASA